MVGERRLVRRRSWVKEFMMDRSRIAENERSEGHCARGVGQDAHILYWPAWLSTQAHPSIFPVFEAACFQGNLSGRLKLRTLLMERHQANLLPF